MTDVIGRRHLAAVRRADLGHHRQEGHHRPRKRAQATGKRDVDADCSPHLGSTGGRGRSSRKGGRAITHSPELLSIVALVGRRLFSTRGPCSTRTPCAPWFSCVSIDFALNVLSRCVLALLRFLVTRLRLFSFFAYCWRTQQSMIRSHFLAWRYPRASISLPPSHLSHHTFCSRICPAARPFRDYAHPWP